MSDLIDYGDSDFARSFIITKGLKLYVGTYNKGILSRGKVISW